MVAWMYQGEPHGIIIGKPLVRKSQLPTLFANFQVIITKKLIQKIIITGQINIAVNGKYLPQRFQVIIANKSLGSSVST